MANPKLVLSLLLVLAASFLVVGIILFGPDQEPDAPSSSAATKAGVAASSSVADDFDWTNAAVSSIAAGGGGGRSAVSASGSTQAMRSDNVLFGLLSIEDSRARQAYLDRVTPALAALSPDEALALVWQLEDGELRDMAMLALLQEWSGVSTLELIRSGNIWRFGTTGALASHLLESGQFTAAQAAELALRSDDGRRRGDLLSRIGAQLALEDPAAAVALADTLDPRQQERFLNRLATNLAADSPQLARQVASTIADPASRAAMMARILEAEAARNPAEAARNFLTLPPETAEAQARAARRIAESWAGQDTLAAMQWAGSLGDDNAQAAARQGINAAAPVGIGARLATGEGGVPVLRDVVPGGPASMSGQLRPGDAVLAVSDANGGWLESRGMQVRELVNLIRGEPNTQVSLQVQSPGEAVPRVVTIGRQQVIHRLP